MTEKCREKERGKIVSEERRVREKKRREPRTEQKRTGKN